MDEDNGGTIEIEELEKAYKAMRELAIGIESGNPKEELFEFILANEKEKQSLKIAKDLDDEKISEILTKID